MTHTPPVVAAAAASFLSLGAASRRSARRATADTSAHETLNIITEALSGLVLGISLSISGMPRREVSGFSRSRPPPDPSLISSWRSDSCRHPWVPDGQVEEEARVVRVGIPKNNKLDKKLLRAVFFGG